MYFTLDDIEQLNEAGIRVRLDGLSCKQIAEVLTDPERMMEYVTVS